MLFWFSWLILVVAVTGLAICVYLWFRRVQSIMREQKRTVESAAGQLAAFRSQVVEKHYDPDLAKIIMRCENLYRQAETQYHETYYKPWIWLPATIMGFHAIPPEDYYTLGKNWKR